MSIVGSAGSGLGGVGDIGGALGSFYSHTIGQSLRFEDGDSAHLSRNPDANSSNGRNLNTTSFWVKRGNLGSTQMMYAVGSSFPSNHNDSSVIQFLSDDTLRYRTEAAGSATSQLDTTRVFRDVSSWYHIHLIFDRDNSTETDRLRLYINGVRETVFDSADYPTTSENSHFTNNKITYIGRSTTNYFDGYIAEFVSIDSAAVSHDSFGELKDGIWIPKDISSGLTYGDNGFHLTFEATGTATTDQDTTAQTNIGDDQSGLGNNFAVSTLVASDVVPDSPTNNFAVMNVLDKSSMTLSQGNLRPTPTGDYKGVRGNFAIPLTGKWFFEARVTTGGGGNITDQFIGIATDQNVLTGSSPYAQAATYGVLYKMAGSIGRLGSDAETGLASFAAGDVLGVAINSTDNEVQFYKNGSTVGSAVALPSTTKNSFAFFAGATSRSSVFNFGQDSTFNGAVSAGSATDGVGTFQSLPTDFKALCTTNFDEPAIIDGSEYFNTVLYAGNSGTQAITGVGFQPDWVWNKVRNHTYSHASYDSIRGASKRLYQDHVYDEADESGLTSFDADGFTLGSAAGANATDKTYVSWNWLAGGSAASNSDGTISSSISANPEAGFSIVSWSGTSSAGTVGHGLGKTPTMYIVKNRTGDYFWAVYHSGLANPTTSYIDLDNNVAQSTSQTHWNSTAPTDTVFSVNNQLSVNHSSHTYIAYCFADIEGYCKAGSYTGLNASDNTYVHLGFRPAWVMCKSYTQGGGGYDWVIYDNTRSPANPVSLNLEANNNIDDEATRGVPIDFLSNGFKIRNSYSEVGSNKGYIYLAFAEQPFKYSNAR
tara:strand:- start:821 stop:3283 length:2463 start_codon:yes stop_codon:yes gene_type:complete